KAGVLRGAELAAHSHQHALQLRQWDSLEEVTGEQVGELVGGLGHQEGDQPLGGGRDLRSALGLACRALLAGNGKLRGSEADNEGKAKSEGMGAWRRGGNSLGHGLPRLPRLRRFTRGRAGFSRV